VGVVNETKGTAFKARPKDIEVAGKTGTAQVQGRRDAANGYDTNDHAWFVGFAPASRPRIALAVLVEHGGHGGEVAAPLAVEIVNNYFETVAPDQKNVPRLGLPRRRGGAAIPNETRPAAAPKAAPVKAAPGEAPPMRLDFSQPDAPEPKEAN
jgi:penicillin-binding protein 2